jgi:histidyl-tRNA synthetase
MSEQITLLRNATGTRDLVGQQVDLKQYVVDTFKNYCKKYDGMHLELSVLECFSSITTLYGEDFNKLVYLINVTESEKLFLRYDQTLPLCRYAVMNSIKQGKFYQIGRVYRKDDPQVSKGRFREFYQCDFDIIGSDLGSNIYDTEILNLFSDVLTSLIGENTYTIKLNHKMFINEMLEKAYVPNDLIETVSSTLDKLDKLSLQEIELELNQKNIPSNCIGILLRIIDCTANLTHKQKLQYFKEQGYQTIDLIEQTFDILNFLNKNMFTFEPFLIRGMAYYTGIIYEATLIDKNILSSSIGGGGRYDNMIKQMYDSTLKETNNSPNVPAIGFSIGVDRIITFLNYQMDKENKGNKQTPIQVYVGTIGSNMIKHRIKIASEIRNMGLTTTMSHLLDPKMGAQLNKDVLANNIPFMIIVGQQEIESNTVKIKDIFNKNETIVNRNEIIDYFVNKKII